MTEINKDLLKRIAKLEKAILDADSWVKASEGVHLEYYHYHGYGEDDSVRVIVELRSNTAHL